MGKSEKRVKPKTLPKSLAKIWDEVAGKYPANSDLEIEALCGLVRRLREARALIDEDGLVVKGSGGNAVSHPALETERQVTRELRAWEKDATKARRGSIRPTPRG